MTGSTTGAGGADTFTATGTVAGGEIGGDSSANGTYSMDFALDNYADQGGPDPAWSMTKYE